MQKKINQAIAMALFNIRKLVYKTLLFSPFVFANGALAGGISIEQQQQQIIQQQQQRQQELQDRIKSQQNNRQVIEVAPEQDTKTEKGGPCFEIDTITLQGANNMPETDQQKLTTSYIGECIDLNGINALLKAVSQWYYSRGYVTTRAYIGNQNLSTGELTIKVIEGKIESYRLKDPNARINVDTAFPASTGDLLNLRDIEQGLEQINRLQSRQVTMDIVPGQLPGDSIIDIQSQLTKPWTVSLTHDNTGQASTGELINTLFVGVDNPLGLNDYTYLNVQKEGTSANDKSNDSFGWHWDMPWGYWNLGVDINYFKYSSSLSLLANTFQTSGTSLTQNISLSRVVYRNKNSKLKLKTSLERKKIENFIEKTLLESNSRVLGIGQLGVDYEYYTASQSQWQLGLNYYRGLRLFSAPNDNDTERSLPRAQFERFLLRTFYQKQAQLPIGAAGIPISFSSDLNIQYSPDRLFGSEQIGVGSLYTVRGYQNNNISAASGAYWRNTLSTTLNTQWGGRFLQQVSPFIAYDVGRIRDRDNNFSRHDYYGLQGAAIGFNLAGQFLSANLTYSRPLDKPSNFITPQEQWYFNVKTFF